MTKFTYSRMTLIPCLIVVMLHLFERVFAGNDIVSNSAIAIESLLALGIGYMVILLDRDETLTRCWLLAATVGITKFLLVLPGYLFQWNTSHEYAIGIAGYFLFSAIAIGYYSFLGFCGGKFRQLIIKSKKSN